jgi:chromosome segregation ATPase
MADLDVQLKNIQEKLQQLLRSYQVLQKENLQLKEALQQARSAYSDKDAKLKQVQEQLDVLQLSSPNRSAAERKALEKRIDSYLKEIEKCLSLLNA